MISSITALVNVTSHWDSLFNICVRLMEESSKMMGLTYTEINIWLFVILGPISTLIFMGSTITALTGKRKTAKVLAVAGLIVLLLLIVPIILPFASESGYEILKTYLA